MEKLEGEEGEKYEIMPLKIAESAIENTLYDYLERLEGKIKNTYAPLNQIIEKASSGYEDSWMIFKEKNKSRDAVDGLAVFNIDPSVTSAIRVTIIHLSTLKSEGMEEAISKTLDYIWKNIHCTEIRIGLIH